MTALTPTTTGVGCFSTTILVASIIAAFSKDFVEHFALLPSKTYSGGEMHRTLHLWNLVTCHFFDVSLVRVILTLPLLTGMVHELQSFLSFFHVLLLLMFAAVASGVTAFICKVTIWVVIQSETDFFSPSASLLCLLGAAVVAFTQAHLPSSVTPGAALVPLPAGASSTTLPATPVAVPPFLLTIPTLCCQRPSTTSSRNFAANHFSFSTSNTNESSNDNTFANSIRSICNFLEIRFISVDVVSIFSSSHSSRPVLRRIDALPWNYVVCVAVCCFASKLLMFIPKSTFIGHAISQIPPSLSILFDFVDLVFAVSGIFYSWLFLRFMAFYISTGQRGDPSQEFSFEILFPSFLRSWASRVGGACGSLANSAGISVELSQNAAVPRLRNTKNGPSFMSARNSDGFHLNNRAGGPGSSTWLPTPPATVTEIALRAKGMKILEHHIEKHTEGKRVTSREKKPASSSSSQTFEVEEGKSSSPSVGGDFVRV